MCVVSNVGDYYGRTFPRDYPDWFPNTMPITFPQQPIMPVVPAGVSQEEFDALKKEVEKMKKLLKKAKEIDEATEQPNCEMEDKVAMLKRLAALVGVDLKDVFGERKTP
jgi:hypothetical protein